MRTARIGHAERAGRNYSAHVALRHEPPELSSYAAGATARWPAKSDVLSLDSSHGIRDRRRLLELSLEAPRTAGRQVSEYRRSECRGVGAHQERRSISKALTFPWRSVALARQRTVDGIS